MLRLIQAGLVAALLQLAAVGLATLAVILSVRIWSIAPASSNVEAVSNFPLLTWIYLLTALGVALTSNRFIDRTALYIHRASKVMRPVEPEYIANALLVRLSLAAIGFAVLALRSPPGYLIELGQYIGCSDAASIAWSGTLSIGAAGLGANAHAARGAAIGKQSSTV